MTMLMDYSATQNKMEDYNPLSFSAFMKKIFSKFIKAKTPLSVFQEEKVEAVLQVEPLKEEKFTPEIEAAAIEEKSALKKPFKYVRLIPKKLTIEKPKTEMAPTAAIDNKNKYFIPDDTNEDFLEIGQAPNAVSQNDEIDFSEIFQEIENSQRIHVQKKSEAQQTNAAMSAPVVKKDREENKAAGNTVIQWRANNGPNLGASKHFRIVSDENYETNVKPVLFSTEDSVPETKTTFLPKLEFTSAVENHAGKLSCQTQALPDEEDFEVSDISRIWENFWSNEEFENESLFV